MVVVVVAILVVRMAVARHLGSFEVNMRTFEQAMQTLADWDLDLQSQLRDRAGVPEEESTRVSDASAVHISLSPKHHVMKERLFKVMSRVPAGSPQKLIREETAAKSHSFRLGSGFA